MKIVRMSCWVIMNLAIFKKNILEKQRAKQRFAGNESIDLVNNIYFVFWRFKDNLFALIHNKLLHISILIISTKL